MGKLAVGGVEDVVEATENFRAKEPDAGTIDAPARGLEAVQSSVTGATSIRLACSRRARRTSCRRWRRTACAGSFA